VVNFYLCVNLNEGSFRIPVPDQINIGDLSTSKICCDIDFDTKILSIFKTVKSYMVLGKTLKLLGDSGKIE
jgi:hypothetical protein